MDVAGDPLLRMLCRSSDWSRLPELAECGMRNGLHDSERMDGTLSRAVRRCSDRRDGGGDENDSDVEHSDRPLLTAPNF